MATIQWSTLTRAVVIAIGIILAGWLFYIAGPIIGPLIIAALLAYVLNPLVRLVQAWARLSRKWSVPIVYFSGLALLVTIPSMLAPAAIKLIRNFLGRLVNVETQLATYLGEPVTFVARVVENFRVGVGVGGDQCQAVAYLAGEVQLHAARANLAGGLHVIAGSHHYVFLDDIEQGQIQAEIRSQVVFGSHFIAAPFLGVEGLTGVDAA